ncbi:hypothetical protein ON010_g15913 [Phytophthora cinnamomi]|nr:hypothetical protein ON010_g15913 [Phytophthora cinnamomi]
MTSFVSVVREISQDYGTKLTNIAQGRRKRGQQADCEKAERSSAARYQTDTDGMTIIDLPTPVDMPDGDILSDSDPEAAEGSESDEEAAPDFSIEPGEDCADENQEAVVQKAYTSYQKLIVLSFVVGARCSEGSGCYELGTP